MIFKKINLTEDTQVLTEGFVNKVEDLTRGFTDDMKYELEMGAGGQGSIDWNNPSAFFKPGASLREDAWTNAFQSSSGANADNLIKLFIQCTMLPKPLTTKELDGWGDILVSIIKQIGFKRNENPFLKFLDTKKFELKRDDVINLNNLWSDGIINEADLSGTGPEKKNHIIFNPYLYNSQNNLVTDEWNIVKAYHDLSSRYSINDLNLDAIARMEQSPKTYKTLSNSMKQTDTKAIRNIIIFADLNNPMGEINKYYWIQKAMNVGLNNADTSDNYDVKGYINLKGVKGTDFIERPTGNNDAKGKPIIYRYPIKFYRDNRFKVAIEGKAGQYVYTALNYRDYIDGNINKYGSVQKYRYDKTKGYYVPIKISQTSNENDGQQKNNQVMSNSTNTKIFQQLKQIDKDSLKNLITNLRKDGTLSTEDMDEIAYLVNKGK